MTELAKRYGTSLYDLAAEEGLEDAILADAEGCGALLEEHPDYLQLLSQPAIPKRERCALLDEAFAGQVHPYMLSFMKILCENGALRELKGCVRQYRRCYDQAHGILEAVAVTAVELPEASRSALEAKLCAMTGKTVRLTLRIDPQVLGGIRLDLDGASLDGTVQSRLNTLRRSIAEATL